MPKQKIAWVLFIVAMILFHYHSTGHFIWAILRIPAKYPLDPVEGWWALLKGILPAVSLWLVFAAGIISKSKRPD